MFEQALRVPGDSPAGQQPSAVVDEDFVTPALQVVDQDFAPSEQSNMDLNSAEFEEHSTWTLRSSSFLFRLKILKIKKIREEWAYVYHTKAELL